MLNKSMTVTILTLLLSGLPGLGSADELPSPPEGLEKAEPVVCKSNDNIVLKNKIIETDGVAIVVQGNCDVEIENCYIVGQPAIEVKGNGDIHIDKSFIIGKEIGATVHGNGDIHINSSIVIGTESSMAIYGNGDIYAGSNIFKGKIDKVSFKGDFHDEGNNQYE